MRDRNQEQVQGRSYGFKFKGQLHYSDTFPKKTKQIHISGITNKIWLTVFALCCTSHSRVCFHYKCDLACDRLISIFF